MSPRLFNYIENLLCGSVQGVQAGLLAGGLIDIVLGVVSELPLKDNLITKSNLLVSLSPRLPAEIPKAICLKILLGIILELSILGDPENRSTVFN